MRCRRPEREDRGQLKVKPDSEVILYKTRFFCSSRSLRILAQDSSNVSVLLHSTSCRCNPKRRRDPLRHVTCARSPINRCDRSTPVTSIASRCGGMAQVNSERVCPVTVSKHSYMTCKQTHSSKAEWAPTTTGCDGSTCSSRSGWNPGWSRLAHKSVERL